ncbi:MAG: endonuclease [bacterium]|nr:endonuclease [bacterium]
MITANEIYEKLEIVYGKPRWWSDDPYIVMVQSILVQNTVWSSVEKVTDTILSELKPERLLRLDDEKLQEMIRSCGFCKGKSATIRRITQWYGKYSYNANTVRKLGKDQLRKELLSIKGIGAETADVILVYAFHKPSFVIDTYTRRFLERMGFQFDSDDEIRTFFEIGVDEDFQIYGWLHWLLLEHGIEHCKKVPVCDKCAFEKDCKNCG